ncbi:hypothetical protein GGP49_002974 [Salinibacter ruber]|uniref:site-specific integrase n=1 Tax=Salinibacter ruber TaxID=146919 RepID=UPI002168D5CA|nr:site-specific integrase [Salinibacter ruber]MCS4116024.1 hypothetical protein [Salinibacter ruber]
MSDSDSSSPAGPGSTDKDAEGENRPDDDSEVVEEFVGRYDKQTRRAYRNDLEMFFEDRFDEKRVGPSRTGEVSSEDVRNFLTCRFEPDSRSTLRRRASTLKSLFEWLSKKGHVEENPFEDLPKISSLLDQIEEGPGAQKSSGGVENSSNSASTEEEDSPKQNREDGPAGGEADEGVRDLLDMNLSSYLGRSAPEDLLEVPSWAKESARDLELEGELLGEEKWIRLGEAAGRIRQAVGEIVHEAYRLAEQNEPAKEGVVAIMRPETHDSPKLRPVSQLERLPQFHPPDLPRFMLRIRHSLDSGLEMTLDHDALTEDEWAIFRNYSPPVPLRAIWFLRGRGWLLPNRLLDFIKAAGSPLDPQYPTWQRREAGSMAAHHQVAVEATSAMGKGLGYRQRAPVKMVVGSPDRSGYWI